MCHVSSPPLSVYMSSILPAPHGLHKRLLLLVCTAYKSVPFGFGRNCPCVACIAAELLWPSSAACIAILLVYVAIHTCYFFIVNIILCAIFLWVKRTIYKNILTTKISLITEVQQ